MTARGAVGTFLRVLGVWAFAALAAAQAPTQPPAQTSAGAGERQVVAGTTVSLTPLPGFVLSTRFSGFENVDIQASLMITELPDRAYAEVAKLFTDLATAKSQFATRGITVTALEDIEVGTSKVPLIVGTQTNAGATHRKWIALFKGEQTVMITVQAPDAEAPAATLDSAAVRRMFGSVSLGARPTAVEKIKVLPFTIEAHAPFRIMDTLAGASLAMTAAERDKEPTPDDPLLMVASGIGAPVPVERLDEMAESLLTGTKNFVDVKIATRERVSFAGTTGVLLGGTYSARGARKRFVHYVALDESGHYIRMIADASESEFEKLQPAIAAIAKSITFR